jgi:hypothetical protein
LDHGAGREFVCGGTVSDVVLLLSGAAAVATCVLNGIQLAQNGSNAMDIIQALLAGAGGVTGIAVSVMSLVDKCCKRFNYRGWHVRNELAKIRGDQEIAEAKRKARDVEEGRAGPAPREGGVRDAPKPQGSSGE